VEEPKRILVRFLQAIPAIIGPDMKAYGPFKEEDVASLPAENAEILITRGVAKEALTQ
jgi:DNA replication factor GINS